MVFILCDITEYKIYGARLERALPFITELNDCGSIVVDWHMPFLPRVGEVVSFISDQHFIEVDDGITPFTERDQANFEMRVEDVEYLSSIDSLEDGPSVFLSLSITIKDWRMFVKDENQRQLRLEGLKNR